MSFFTDFLLATKPEAKRVGRTRNPTEHWFGSSWKNLTSLDLAALYGAMRGDTSTEAIIAATKEFEDLDCDRVSVDLYLFPEAFTSLLAAIEPPAIPALVVAWRATDVEVSHWEVADVQALLEDLCGLAMRAVLAGKPIMLCISGF
jgi:hypothetical protein